MCGRYTFFTDKELSEIDEIIEQISNDTKIDKMKTGEIFPTDLAPILIPKDKIISPDLMVFGFPGFKNNKVIINARAETAREKKMFANAFNNNRCVVPSTGFYEWDSQKRKFLFKLHDKNMLYMAGLYGNFEGENRFVILTTQANHSMSEVHSRMPVILAKDQLSLWLFDRYKAGEIITSVPPELDRLDVHH